MRRLVAIFCGVGFIICSCVSASAGTIPTQVYEPFAYSNGNLVGNTNPTAPSSMNGFSDTNDWTATGTGNVTVISGDLSYPDLPTTTSGHMAQTAGLVTANNGNPVHIGIGEYDEGSEASTIY